jgi:two-component system CitB family response regulator
MIRVAVVDDDFRVANLHATYVNQMPGFEVLGIAHTARSAVELAATSSPDLMLLDLYLPDAPGTHVIRQVSCDVMMLTGASDTADVRLALRLGVVNYLVKPFTDADLAARLRAYAGFRSQIGATSSLEQAEIDSAVRTLHSGDFPVVSMSKGLSSHTAQLIIEAVRKARQPIPASQVAEGLGLSRGTAQRYLSELAAQGRVAVALRYGTSGRPEHLYSCDTANVVR